MQPFMHTCTDVIPFVFTSNISGNLERRRWTAKEFEQVQFDESGECSWLNDEELKERVSGPFRLLKIGEEEVSMHSLSKIKEIAASRGKAIADARPKKQVEIFVVHQNIIRYFFLKLLQFDTTAWLNLGGSNCTMTQLRLTRRGDVICDFFGDHGSKMPVSHYTFNEHPDI